MVNHQSSSYKQLIVWQKSMVLAKKVCNLSDKFPQSEQFGLKSQLQRAATSMPSNIAEGRGRSSKNEFARFLYISKGSASERETQLILSADIGLLQRLDIESVLDEIDQVKSMIHSLALKRKAGQ